MTSPDEIERAAIEAAALAIRKIYAPSTVWSQLLDAQKLIHLKEARAAIAAYNAAKWQPIETAPVGFSVLTNSKHGLIQGDVEPDGTVCGYYWREMSWYATHWQPLPQPPEQKRSAADEWHHRPAMRRASRPI